MSRLLCLTELLRRERAESVYRESGATARVGVQGRSPRRRSAPVESGDLATVDHHGARGGSVVAPDRVAARGQVGVNRRVSGARVDRALADLGVAACPLGCGRADL